MEPPSPLSSLLQNALGNPSPQQPTVDQSGGDGTQKADTWKMAPIPTAFCRLTDEAIKRLICSKVEGPGTRNQQPRQACDTALKPKCACLPPSGTPAATVLGLTPNDRVANCVIALSRLLRCLSKIAETFLMCCLPLHHHITTAPAQILGNPLPSLMFPCVETRAISIHPPPHCSQKGGWGDLENR